MAGVPCQFVLRIDCGEIACIGLSSGRRRDRTRGERMMIYQVDQYTRIYKQHDRHGRCEDTMPDADGGSNATALENR